MEGGLLPGDVRLGELWFSIGGDEEVSCLGGI